MLVNITIARRHITAAAVRLVILVIVYLVDEKCKTFLFRSSHSS